MELQGRKVALPSGASLVVKPATYADTEEFLAAFLESVAGLPSNFTKEDGSPNEEIVKLVSELAVTKAFTNAKLKSSMWKCLAYCLYGTTESKLPEKITPQLFDTGANRSDLPDIFYECAVENFSPFLKGLWNVSSRLASQIKNTPKPS